MKTKVAYFWELVFTPAFRSTVWLDFNLKSRGNVVLLKKSIQELTEEEALWIVSIARNLYYGKHLKEIDYLRKKYSSVERCFEKKKCPLGGDNYEIFKNPDTHKYTVCGYTISERLYNDAINQRK